MMEQLDFGSKGSKIDLRRRLEPDYLIEMEKCIDFILDYQKGYAHPKSADQIHSHLVGFYVYQHFTEAVRDEVFIELWNRIQTTKFCGKYHLRYFSHFVIVDEIKKSQ